MPLPESLSVIVGNPTSSGHMTLFNVTRICVKPTHFCGATHTKKDNVYQCRSMERVEHKVHFTKSSDLEPIGP